MKKGSDSEKCRKKRITFRLEGFEAERVCLVGEFNNWNAKAHPMKKNGNGRWVKPILLPAGQFEYKFIVDDLWMPDPNNERSCPNCFGTRNSIVNVVV